MDLVGQGSLCLRVRSCPVVNKIPKNSQEVQGGEVTTMCQIKLFMADQWLCGCKQQKKPCLKQGERQGPTQCCPLTPMSTMACMCASAHTQVISSCTVWEHTTVQYNDYLRSTVIVSGTKRNLEIMKETGDTCRHATSSNSLEHLRTVLKSVFLIYQGATG